MPMEIYGERSILNTDTAGGVPFGLQFDLPVVVFIGRLLRITGFFSFIFLDVFPDAFFILEEEFPGVAQNSGLDQGGLFEVEEQFLYPPGLVAEFVFAHADG